MIVGLVAILVVTLVGRRIVDESLRSQSDAAVRWGIYIAWTLFAIFALNRLRNRFIRNATQSRARSAEAELERSGMRRPILYLRSFALDQQIQRPSWFERFLGSLPLESAEQELTKALKKVGPTIAIGRPGEHLPGLGAARFYCSDDRWQQKVADVAAESQCIVWASGVTEGLRWEISHLVQSTLPEKLILWAHPHIMRLAPREREAEWSRFLVALGSAFPKPLPERLGEARFIYFSAGWAPHPVAPPRGPVPWFSAIRATLATILSLKAGTAPLSDAKLWLGRLGRVGLGLLLGAILAAVIAPALDDHSEVNRENGRIVYQYGHANAYHEGGMLANIGLTLLTASMIWSRRTWWRRTRLCVVGGLAGIALLCAVLAVMDEHQQASQRTSMASLATKTDAKDASPEPVTMMTYVRQVQAAVYLKLAWAVVLAVTAVVFVRTGWSPIPEPMAPPLTDADLAYAGPGNDTFAELIGAGWPSIDWPRVTGFFLALVALRLPTIFLGAWSTEISVGVGYIAASIGLTIVWAAIVTGAAVVAFRFLRSVVAPLVAATAVAIVWALIGPAELSMARAAQMLVATLFLLAGLSWSVGRMAPRPLALWCGAMWSPVVVWLMRLFVGGDMLHGANNEVLSGLLGSVLLAAVMETALRFMPTHWGRIVRKSSL